MTNDQLIGKYTRLRQELTQAYAEPVASATRSGLIDRVGGDARLQYLDFVSGKSTTVAHNLGEVGAGLTASADGKTILFNRVDASVDDLMLVENFR